MLKNVDINNGSQVVSVGDEKVFFASGEQFVNQVGIDGSVKQVSMTRGVPAALFITSGARDGQKSVAIDSRVTRLVEGDNIDVVVGVFLDDALSIFVGVEGVHEDERHVDVVRLVQVLQRR